MAEQVENAITAHTKELLDTPAPAATSTCTNCCNDASAAVAADNSEAFNGELEANVVDDVDGDMDAESEGDACCHLSMKMSIDAATPRICGDRMQLKCDAITAMRDALAVPPTVNTNSKLSAALALPARATKPAVTINTTQTHNISGIPPCQLLERLSFPEGNIINTLHTILSLPPFDPHAPAPKSNIVYKEVVSLMQWSLREDNAIELELSEKLLHECHHTRESDDPNDDTRSYMMAIEDMRLFSEDPKTAMRDADGQLRAITNLALIFVKHRKEEFFTFCSCKECLEYRETIMAIMMDQFKAAHMVVMLLDVLIKAYSPMLKNDAAYNKFEKLLECNKEIYWITSGFLYDKNAEYLDFIDDTAISDNMILVLFSSILMANNPMLLLQILAYNVECIVKAFSEGIIEIAQNEHDNAKTSAEKMLAYLLDGYSDFNCMSQKISLSLFAFENDFLRKFKLSWVILCQRLFQQHVFNPLGDTMLACILSLKEAEPTAQTAALIKRYMMFDEHMHSIERRWTDIWIELNKYNLSVTEHERRMGLLDVYNIFDKVVMDATSFSLPDISDDEFIDFQRIVDRQLAWKNIMAFTKLKWPDGFYDPPNKLVYEELCKKCKAMLEHHDENCKCITCSIAGTPLSPRQAGHCAKCTTLGIVEKDAKLMKSKILSTCTSDEAKHNAATSTSAATAAAQQRRSEQPELVVDEPNSALFRRQENNDTLRATYHIAWAVFQHLITRKRYRHDSIEPQFFCSEKCCVAACQLGRKILANELSPPLTKHLLRCFQPLSLTREELRSTLPSLMFFNRKLAPSPAELQELKNQHHVYRTYWIFVVSIYANFFVKFNSNPTDLRQLELVKGDLRLRTNNLVGDKNDGRFEQFLAQIIGYSPFKITDDFTLGDANIEKMQFGVDHLMMLADSQMIKRNKPDSTTNTSSAAGTSSKSKTNEMTQTLSNASSEVNQNVKKPKEKMRKCCADYADIGEPCKENHSKKRVKKECNHARFNETRDRLRKKLTQIANDRKGKCSTAESNATTTAPAPTTATVSTTGSSSSSASSAITTAATPTELFGATNIETSSLTSISGRNKSAETVVPLTNNNNNSKQPPPLKVFAAAQLEVANKARKIPPAAAAAVAAAAATLNELNCQVQDPDNSLLCLDTLCKSIQMHSDVSAAARAVAHQLPNDLDNYSKEDMINDFAEFLGTYTIEHDKKRWLNETLNFIEGKVQPQTANPKKAAKKAKQKQRKEEEKRIKELEDLRCQFLDIYFKEFFEKYQMKALTSTAGGRKKEKKRISELEANIKNLQRAKAKVETVILELIATVKQTNSDFKFSYLPTKEQQMAKLAELEESTERAEPPPPPTEAMRLQSQAEALKLPYPDFSSPTAYFPPTGPQHTPVCYAPPQQQHLPRDVIAAMTANAMTADPSKRIVTIRRVQLPHAGGEQQVTVVAKGSSPDEDKLLYTFVNGHIVTSESNISEVQPQQLAQPLQPAPQLEKNAKLKKKEAKRTAIAAAAVAAAEQAAKVAKTNTAKAKKQKKVATTQALMNSSSSTSGNSSSNSQTPQSSAVNTRENSLCSMKPGKQVTAVQQSKKTASVKQQQTKNSKTSAEVQVTTKKTVLPTVEPTAPVTSVASTEVSEKVVKRQKRNKAALDQGQFDNNPFKSLHMQDSSEAEWESGSESESSIEMQPALKQQPKVKLVKQEVAVKPQTASAPKQKPSVSAPMVVENSAVPKTGARVVPAVAIVPAKKTKNEPQLNKPVHQQQQQQQQQQPLQQKQAHLPQKAAAVAPSNRKLQQPANGKRIGTGGAQYQQSVQASHGKSQAAYRAPAAESTSEITLRKSKASGQQGLSSHRSTGSQSQSSLQSHSQRGGSRSSNLSGRVKTSSSQQTSAATGYAGDSSTSQTSKRSQRGKRGHRQKLEDLSGIPNHMGYFNPNEVAIPPPAPSVSVSHNVGTPMASYASTLTQQMQHLRIGKPPQHSAQAAQQSLPNCSIMDQLNRGVQVEHLSLPPGITLTKVDPVKSEQLRQKSESIGKLSKPLADSHLQQQAVYTAPQPHLMTGYFAGGAGLDTMAATGATGGVIMVEAKSTRPNRSSNSSSGGGGSAAASSSTSVNVAAAAAAASASGKSSRRRRRNRGRSNGSVNGLKQQQRNTIDQMAQPTLSASGNSKAAGTDGGVAKIITLRNPMFQQAINAGGNVGPGASVSSSSGISNMAMPGNVMMTNRPYGGTLPIAAPLPMDQPAAIIKNENGMFTIRNPALHQAVTNGLAMGGYRQFGSNVSYYTPQEAVAEAARATQLKQTHSTPVAGTGSASGRSSISALASAPTNFSYFSSGGTGSGGDGSGTHNNISISCTNVPPRNNHNYNSVAGRLMGDAAIIARPKQAQKYLSAIGSEIKQKTKDSHGLSQAQCNNHWSTFGPTATDYEYGANAGTGASPAVHLQEKYQQSSYYNGFEVFGAASAQQTVPGNSSVECHMHHHSCGDESPPPTITGFNSYLEGIPNTGVIRYDDAAFLKNLLPGQHLNNEVSIHNISESNFARNNASPAPHHVEITTVFGNRGARSNMEPTQAPMNSGVGANYCDNVTGDYGSDSSHIFGQNNMLPRMPQPSQASDPFGGYDFDASPVGSTSKPASVASDLNEFLRRSPHSQRTSPYSIDEASFVQNMSALQIATATNAVSNAEQCSRLNGTDNHGGISGGAVVGSDPPSSGGGPVADVAAAAVAAANWW